MTTTKLPPNAGQKAAADAFFDFLLTDQKEFHISGAAGVGKTFLMSYIIDNTMTQYHKTCDLLGIKPLYTDVVMTATTNKAAAALSTAVGRPTSTIHSFLNLRVQDDFSTGKTLLTRTRDWKVHQNLIIFIDECSMIDADLDAMIQEGTQDCKIVYVGDHNQLPPVFEKKSSIYRRKAPFFELTEPMRNNNQPALMAVCQQLRETVETGVFKPIQIVPGVIDYLGDAAMQDKIAEYFQPGTNLTTRILAYSNKHVTDYNGYIRELRQLPTEFIPGEVVVNNAAIRMGNNQMSAEQEFTISDTKGIVNHVIEGGVDLAVQLVELSNEYGDIIYSVPVPVDKDHYNRLLKYYAGRKNWERYYYLKNNYPDLRPRDAATVHKSQGSTYQSVFIDLENISKCTQEDVAARLLYVAFSRARERVYLHGNLTQRYGGLIR